MKKKNYDALSDFMRDHSVSVSEVMEILKYMSLKNKHQKPEVEVIYTDNKQIKGLSVKEIELDLADFSIPLSYIDGLKNCRQAGKRMLKAEQALVIYNHLQEVNETLSLIGAEPIKLYRYWIDDQASKTYLAKVFDFQTGQIREVKRSESYRVRPVLF